MISLEWTLVAEKKECSGGEIKKGRLTAVDDCGMKCKGVASMFAYGTNDFGKNRCYDDGCECLCETAATDEQTCNIVDHKGYRLYKFPHGDYSICHK